MQTLSEYAPGSDVVDESALAREVIGDCRRNVALLRDVGRRLDEEYSRERLAERRALHVQRERAPKEEQFEIPGPRRVTHALNYGPSYWADRQDWPKRADPAHQLQNRFLAALHDVMGGKLHSNLRPVVDRESALIVLLLHWLLADESASSFEPKVCKFQTLPWFTEKMVGRRTVATMWFASPHKAQWYRRVKEALDWARLQSVPADVVCVSGYGRITFRGHVVDFETSQQRAVIAKLYEANAATMSLGAPIHESLLEAVADGGSGWSIRKLFSGHAAYKTILRPAKGKGMWALYFDDEAEALLKKKEIGQLGGQLGGQVEAKTPTRDRNKPRNSGRAGSASTSQREVDSR